MMNQSISPRQRVEAALLGETPDMVPFTAYTELFPRCAVERQLRNDGLCLVQRSPSVYSIESPNVVQEELHYAGPDSFEHIRTTIRTPVGTVSGVRRRVPVGSTSMDRVMNWTTWTEEFPFKGPEDYEPLEFAIRDRRYAPSYEDFVSMGEMMGEDAIMRAQIGYSPLLEIIVRLMGVERFSFEWLERRERVLRLYDALTEDRRKVYPLIARSPALITNYGGNVSPEVVGLERFERYVLPHYNEAAEVLHERGKLIGVHFDANVRLLAPGIARSKLDYIEAYTPAPASDLSLAEARAAWPGKVLWINFPSQLFLQSMAVVEETTRQYLRDTAPGDRFLISITEDMPSQRYQEGLLTIMRTLHAGL
jgi:hypothetical protein